MKSGRLGDATSAEVTDISPQGFWLRLGNRRLFVEFAEFPWFQDTSVSDLRKVEWPQPHRLYWPALDIDLAVESIEHPERFPLVAK